MRSWRETPRRFVLRWTLVLCAAHLIGPVVFGIMPIQIPTARGTYRIHASGITRHWGCMPQPIWDFSISFLGVGTIAVVLHAIRPPKPPWHCARCDYNLHANVSGVCPECGKPIDPLTHN
ncbi:MAG: hypothetical protein ACKVS9_06475 [Phycisphaerae bacterium]